MGTPVEKRTYRRFRVLNGLNDSFNLCILTENNFSALVLMQHVLGVSPKLAEITVVQGNDEQKFLCVVKPNYDLSIIHGLVNFFILAQHPGSEYVGWLAGIAERCFAVRRFKEQGVDLVNNLESQQKDWMKSHGAAVNALLSRYPDGVLALHLLSELAIVVQQDEQFREYNFFKYQPETGSDDTN